MIKLLPYKDKIGEEIRPLFFYKAFKREVLKARIISFGLCNFNCSYCKRNGSFRNIDGSIVHARKTTLSEIFRICDDAIFKKQVIRLSGGDPGAYFKDSLLIAKYVKEKKGNLSMAHNGSSPLFAKRMAPFLESAAIDLKSVPEHMSSVIGLKKEIASKMYYSSLKVQKILLDAGVLVDIRTPIFNSTTLDDLLFMASDIQKFTNKKNRFWTLRLYKQVPGCNFTSPNKEKVLQMASQVKKQYPDIQIGIRAHWEAEGFIYL